MAVFRWFPNGRSLAEVLTALGVVWMAISLSACDRGKEAEKKQAAPAPPPPAVVVPAVTYLVFDRTLNVPLPAGLFR